MTKIDKNIATETTVYFHVPKKNLPSGHMFMKPKFISAHHLHRLIKVQAIKIDRWQGAQDIHEYKFAFDTIYFHWQTLKSGRQQ